MWIQILFNSINQTNKQKTTMHESMDAETCALTTQMNVSKTSRTDWINFFNSPNLHFKQQALRFLGLLGFMYHIPFRITFAVLTLFESNQNYYILYVMK